MSCHVTHAAIAREFRTVSTSSAIMLLPGAV